MKLTTKQISEIMDLKNSGKTQTMIAQYLGISQGSVSYWLSDEDKRKEISKRVYEKFKSKSIEERRRIYKSRLPYLREYWRKRYKMDSEFREKEKLKFRKQWKKKK